MDPANDYRGHWIKVQFKAKIDTKAYDTVEKLVAEGAIQEISGSAANDYDNPRAEPNTGNSPVNAARDHSGIRNKASYEIKAANKPDYKDTSNTVTVNPSEDPKIGTTATDDKTGDHIALAENKMTINDVVDYKNFKAGNYVMKGKLIRKSDESVVSEAQQNFTVGEMADGQVTIKFTFTLTDKEVEALKNDALVCYEYAYKADAQGENDEPVAKHENKEDEAQTVVVPEAKTNATEGGDNLAVPGEKVTIVDRVTYKNLIPGKEYEVTGTLHIQNEDGKDGGVLEIDGNPVTKTAKFTAEKADGYVDITFEIDARALEGKKVVAFEEVTYKKKVVAAHEDITDEAQTVEFKTPELRTTVSAAGESGSQENAATIGAEQAGKKINVTDTIAYTNLTPKTRSKRAKSL